MNIFGIGLPEMALIMVVALLVFGPKKLPEIGRSVGKALKSFQDASKEFETEFKKEAERIEKSVAQPMKATLEKPEPKALSPEATRTEVAAEVEDKETAIAQSPTESAPTESAPNESSEDSPDAADKVEQPAA
ncbi:TatA/E family twin arginine-targeting protein translocase [Romeria aff. gracilis LEGE 07310]|uniref:Sec-independent protein translocase protein TatA n=1 Tax=Vasconcelosia minhoensis LEGE 07310 TaxID=915328 RepID=A0A8J7AKR1_9CYAN|nr:TatA/E family twin arginine-targeting protein translocase [Romeria gracilis]MBE9076479.1 TatA/E family twin arginine-targeting protein translocase [Romeria aff. gracilis LEGE 07310]